ncbi:FkbM family methyltransferase [Mucilaginibacter limnophilus]|uniref:FkbM family methyltransferase n=1 Tax=Mucilaginibacter limnophilus TaxID=1932778 RepID=A0A3S2UMI8_9SPHI|nr:FkbM family methyltransferase [Mucilaginibacter limnophilus]RVU02016.1 FkbM family methyltransferase [Mucilaginibacter limnophilus]
MKLKDFLTTLSGKQKVGYLTGAALDRVKNVLTDFESFRDERRFYTDIEHLGFERDTNDIELQLSKNGNKIGLRNNTTDNKVFQQVYIRNEYLPLIDCAKANSVEVSTIVDAGANIGLTSLKLLEYFSAAKVVCLEPDPGNFSQLQRNLLSYSTQTVLLQAALWHSEEELYLGNDFRGGLEWSRNVTAGKKTDASAVSGISLNTLIKQYHLSQIDILKIDIEGSEAEIFKPENDLSFLDITKIIALEIHDEFNCRETIYQILRDRDYVIFNGVELTLGINMRL